MQWIFKNFWYKLFSLSLAAVIWVIIQSEQVLEVNREVMVNLQVPEGYAVRGDAKRAMIATVKGPRVLVMEAAGSLEVDVRLPALAGKRYRVRVDSQDIRRISPRLSVAIHNPYFDVYIDEQTVRTIPIRYVPHGTPAEGYFVKKSVLNPTHVKVTGLKSDVLRIRDVATESVDITGLNQNQTFEVGLVTPSGVKAQNLSINTVTVTLLVGDSHVNRRFGNVAIEVVGANAKTRVEPKFVTVQIQGTPSTLKFVKPEDLKALVEVKDLPPGRHQREVQIKIPPDTVLIENYPKQAVVIIDP